MADENLFKTSCHYLNTPTPPLIQNHFSTVLSRLEKSQLYILGLKEDLKNKQTHNKQVVSCTRSNTGLPKLMSTWNLWMWPCLEIGSLHMWSRISHPRWEWYLSSMTAAPTTRGRFRSRHTQREHRQSLGWLAYKPRNAKECERPPEARKSQKVLP